MTRVVLKVGGRVAAAGRERAWPPRGRPRGRGRHGAGPQITAEMERQGVPVEFVEGRRVTTPAGLDVVRSSLTAVQAEVCDAIGRLALPLAGDEIGLQCRVPQLGLVGEALPCAPPQRSSMRSPLARIPVVLPLARGPLNVNADEAAAALAVGLGAARIVFASDVPGVVVDGTVATELPAAHAAGLLDDGAFEGGIVPKLLAAIRSAVHGIRTEIGATTVTA